VDFFLDGVDFFPTSGFSLFYDSDFKIPQGVHNLVENLMQEVSSQLDLILSSI